MIRRSYKHKTSSVISTRNERLSSPLRRRDSRSRVHPAPILLLSLILVAVFTLGQSCRTPEGSQDEVLEGIELVAHRGFRGVEIGNSLAAITSSIQYGIHAVEFDVSISADGTPYVFHDKTVDYLTNGTGTFTELPDDYIDSLIYTEAADAAGQGIKIPRLSEVLSQLHPGAYIYPEIKNISHLDDISTMMDMIAFYGFADSSNYLSFDPQDLTAVRLENPEAPVSLLVSASGNPSFWQLRMSVNSVAMLGNATIIFSYRNILAHPEIIDYCRDLQLDVAAYT
ncbi:MAG: glycerophosphodiester phosphodiesterase, partial [Spirochaetota bacterium]